MESVSLPGIFFRHPETLKNLTRKSLLWYLYQLDSPSKKKQKNPSNAKFTSVFAREKWGHFFCKKLQGLILAPLRGHSAHLVHQSPHQDLLASLWRSKTSHLEIAVSSRLFPLDDLRQDRICFLKNVHVYIYIYICIRIHMYMYIYNICKYM